MEESRKMIDYLDAVASGRNEVPKPSQICYGFGLRQPYVPFVFSSSSSSLLDVGSLFNPLTGDDGLNVREMQGTAVHEIVDAIVGENSIEIGQERYQCCIDEEVFSSMALLGSHFANEHSKYIWSCLKSLAEDHEQDLCGSLFASLCYPGIRGRHGRHIGSRNTSLAPSVPLDLTQLGSANSELSMQVTDPVLPLLQVLSPESMDHFVGALFGPPPLTPLELKDESDRGLFFHLAEPREVRLKRERALIESLLEMGSQSDPESAAAPEGSARKSKSRARMSSRDRRARRQIEGDCCDFLIREVVSSLVKRSASKALSDERRARAADRLLEEQKRAGEVLFAVQQEERERKIAERKFRREVRKDAALVMGTEIIEDVTRSLVFEIAQATLSAFSLSWKAEKEELIDGSFQIPNANASFTSTRSTPPSADVFSPLSSSFGGENRLSFRSGVTVPLGLSGHPLTMSAVTLEGERPPSTSSTSTNALRMNSSLDTGWGAQQLPQHRREDETAEALGILPEDFELSSERCVEVRNVPFSSDRASMVLAFFYGLNVSRGKNLSPKVHFLLNYDGTSTGTAYVEMETVEDTDRAVERNGGSIGGFIVTVIRAQKPQMSVSGQKFAFTKPIRNA